MPETSKRQDEFSQRSLARALLGLAISLRALVGFHPHSGQDNFEGSKVAYGGDFEAQRHWMEITWHLPIGEWYFYDLEYWGLDYPPLTAYVSYICGMMSHVLVGPESVALDTSRGYEDPVHKSFMRATVIFFDVLIYGVAVWYALDRSTVKRRNMSMWVFALCMAQPAILLIDHGHFQYNTVALGFSIAAFSHIVQPAFKNCIVGSIYFCLALNFKQMTLYYAPAVFCYLLGRCLAQPRYFIGRFVALGLTVVGTFAILWGPIILYGPLGTTYMDRLLHVLGRIFPFQRGLFEGKVANLWCVLSTKPIKIRERLAPEWQPFAALAITFLLICPACIQMLRMGMATSHWNAKMLYRQRTSLLWATMSTALSFFLASFQVHEKSILLALAPCSLLVWDDWVFVDWFSIGACWSLWPLLQTDRLQVPYGCCIIIFLCMIRLRKANMESLVAKSLFQRLAWIPTISYCIMIVLHIAHFMIPAPAYLPDIFEVLWSAVGCLMFGIAWVFSCIKLYQVPVNDGTRVDTKNE